MFTNEITAETPIIQMTAGQLAEYLNSHAAPAQPGAPAAGTQDTQAETPRRYVYGIKGIMRLFGVSNVTTKAPGLPARLLMPCAVEVRRAFCIPYFIGNEAFIKVPIKYL